MAVKQVAIRLKPEGGAEVNAVFRQTEEAGVKAGNATAAATDKATAAAARQEAQWRRNAETYRQAANAADAQARFNAAIGVNDGPSRRAADSASVFAANDDDARRASQIRAEIDPLWAAQNRYNMALEETNRLRRSGHLTVDAAVARENLLQKELDETTAALNRNTSGLTRRQMAGRLNLGRQGADVAVTAAMGMNPGMIAIQQGPQILDAMAESGIRLTPVMIGLAGAIGLSAAAVAGLTAGWLKGEADAKSYDRAVTGIGRTSGLTAAQLQQLVEKNAELGDVSIDAARKQAEAYLSTGRIGGEVLDDLIRLGKDYASFMGVDAEEATKSLARAMEDPHKAGEQMTRTFGLLSQAQLDQIEKAMKAGDQMKAQTILLEALDGAIRGHAEQVGTITNAWDAAGNAIGNAITKLGEWLYVSEGEKLQKLIDQRAGYEEFVAGGRRLTRGQQRVYDEAGREAAAIQARRAARTEGAAERAAEAAANQAAQIREDEKDKTRKPRTDRSAEREARQRLLFERQEADREAELDLMWARASGDVDHARALEDAAALTARIRQLTDDGVDAEKARTQALEEQSRIFFARGVTQSREQNELARTASIEAERLLGMDRYVALEDRRLEVARRTDAYVKAGRDYYPSLLAAVTEVLSVEEARAELMERQIALETRSHQLNLARLSGREGDARRLDIETRTEARARQIERLGRDGKPLNYGEGDAQARIEIAQEVAAQAAGVRRQWLSGFIDDIRSGGIREALASQFEQAADRLIDKLFNALMDMDWGSFLEGGQSGGGGNGVGAWISTALNTFFGGGPGKNAGGTDYWSGGLSWVGENGPELVNLPRGSQVVNAERSMRMMTQAARPQAQAPVNHYYFEGNLMTPEFWGRIQAGDRNAAMLGAQRGAQTAVGVVQASAGEVQRADRRLKN